MRNWIQPLACSDHGLHRILSSYWLAHFYLMKKSTKVLLYFGLDCGMMEFFTYKPQSKEQFISLLCFRSTVWRKRMCFEHMQTMIRKSWRIRGLFAWSGSELGSCFKYSNLKLKNQKPTAVYVIFKAYSMVPLSCRSNLAGQYLYTPPPFHFTVLLNNFLDLRTFQKCGNLQFSNPIFFKSNLFYCK